jgi:hypothetical protein
VYVFFNRVYCLLNYSSNGAMYVYMCVCTYVCMYVCARMYVCVYVFMYVQYSAMK